MWTLETYSYPVARKEYRCDGCDYLNSVGLCKNDFSPEQWEIFQAAMNDGAKINKGDKYFKITGLFDGEWDTYRARVDITKIITDNKWYED